MSATRITALATGLFAALTWQAAYAQSETPDIPIEDDEGVIEERSVEETREHRTVEDGLEVEEEEDSTVVPGTPGNQFYYEERRREELQPYPSQEEQQQPMQQPVQPVIPAPPPSNLQPLQPVTPPAATGTQQTIETQRQWGTYGTTQGATEVKPVEREREVVTRREEHVVRRPSETAHVKTGVGMAVTVGGGVADFIDNDFRSEAETGGTWDARMQIGTRTPMSFEAAYLGAAHNINGFGLSEDAKLVANGAEAALRLNLGTEIWQPFVFGGAAWKHYQIADSAVDATSSIDESGNVLEVPVGGGLAWRARGFVADARFTYRPAVREDFIAGAAMHNWTAGAKVGYEF